MVGSANAQHSIDLTCGVCPPTPKVDKKHWSPQTHTHTHTQRNVLNCSQERHVLALLQLRDVRDAETLWVELHHLTGLAPGCTWFTSQLDVDLERFLCCDSTAHDTLLFAGWIPV